MYFRKEVNKKRPGAISKIIQLNWNGNNQTQNA